MKRRPLYIVCRPDGTPIMHSASESKKGASSRFNGWEYGFWPKLKEKGYFIRKYVPANYDVKDMIARILNDCSRGLEYKDSMADYIYAEKILLAWLNCEQLPPCKYDYYADVVGDMNSDGQKRMEANLKKWIKGDEQ